MSDLPVPRPMMGRDQPSRTEVLAAERLRVLRHPLASNLVTTIRDIETPAAQFESAIHELTRMLIWDATDNEPLVPVDVPSFSGSPVAGTRFARRTAALVILRAGMSMVSPFRSLIPDSPIYQVGIKRDESTLEPLLYYSNLPTSLSHIDHILILDPMLATGGSAGAALAGVRANFVGRVSFLGIIGAPIGAMSLLNTDDNLRVFLASLDDRLNDQGYIVPGLGDAGDRLFGTN